MVSKCLSALNFAKQFQVASPDAVDRADALVGQFCSTIPSEYERPPDGIRADAQKGRCLVNIQMGRPFLFVRPAAPQSILPFT